MTAPAAAAGTAATLLALVEAQAAARASIVETVLALVGRAFAGIGDFYDQAEVADYVDLVAEAVGGGRAVAADTTAAYLAQVLDAQGVVPPRVDHSPATEPRGVPVTRQYARPVVEYRTARLTGLAEFEAEERALRRAQLIAEQDVAMAVRDAAAAVVSAAGPVTGWRRIIHPEMSAGGTCGLCIAASDRVYGKAELLPLHERCACEVLPIVGKAGGDGDPGGDLNAESLRELYERAGDTTAGALARTRWVVHTHGELGPVLRPAGDHFRGPEEVERSTGVPLDLEQYDT